MVSINLPLNRCDPCILLSRRLEDARVYLVMQCSRVACISFSNKQGLRANRKRLPTISEFRPQSSRKRWNRCRNCSPRLGNVVRLLRQRRRFRMRVRVRPSILNSRSVNCLSPAHRWIRCAWFVWDWQRRQRRLDWVRKTCLRHWRRGVLHSSSSVAKRLRFLYNGLQRCARFHLQLCKNACADLNNMQKSWKSALGKVPLLLALLVPL